MALADTRASVDDKDAQPVFGLFQHVADAVERQTFVVAVTPSNLARNRQKLFQASGTWIGEICGAMPLGAGQTFEIGEGLANEQSLETTISALSRADQRANRSIGFSLNRDVLSFAYEVRLPCVDTRQAVERLERIGEELKIRKLVVQQIVHVPMLW